MNSQNPEQVWVTRRYPTTNTTDVPAPPAPVTGTVVTAEEDIKPTIVAAANAALAIAALHAGGNPLGGFVMATYIIGVQTEMNWIISHRPFTLGNVVAAVVTALWKIHGSEQVREMNGMLINSRMKVSGKRGLYHLSRLRPDVELVPVYLENLNRILPKGQSLPVPMMSRVIFGPACPATGRDDKAEFLLKAREALMQLKDTR